MKNILVPYDFSDYANHALDLAVQIADKSNGKVNLAHVIEYPTDFGANIQGEISNVDPLDSIYVKKIIETTTNRLDEVLEQKDSNTELTYSIKLGDPFKTIAEEINEIDYDLVVMGTSGSSGLSEILVGSNTEKMVRYAKCPVISISDSVELSTIKNIAFATNFEDEQDYILKVLSKYQEIFGAKLHLVWINTLDVFQDDDMVKDKLKELAEKNQIGNYDAHIFKALNAERGIMHFAESNEIDMIAMATHGHKGLLHMFIGSIAENIVNHAHRPVWTLSVKGMG